MHTETITGTSSNSHLSRLGIKPRPRVKIEDGLNIRLSLCHPPVSAEAKALAKQLAANIAALEPAGKATRKRLEAVGAVLSDIIRASAMGAGAYAYRSMKADSFTGQHIGRSPYTWARDGLLRLGLVTVVSGGKCAANRSDGIATRVYPKDELCRLASAAGIEPGRWSTHFKIGATHAPPLVMARAKATLSKGAYGDRLPGRAMPVDMDHINVVRDVQRIRAINTYLGTKSITPIGSFGSLTRIYSSADTEAFDYNQGARLYDLVGGYQSINSDARSGIRFDGEPCREIDLSASFFTIYRALNGVQVDPAVDPYIIPGAERGALKAYVCSMFGSGGFPSRWSAEARAKYAEKNGGANLSNVLPVGKAKEHLIRAYPFMADWPSSPVRWGRLQYEESCVILDTVEKLMIEYDCPALPVHDSIIVPQSMTNVAKKVLAECFYNRLGVVPALKVK